MILISSTCSSRPESTSARNAGGSSAPTDGRRVERGADRLAREHRHLVQQLHRVAEQDLGVQVADAVHGEQVVQIQRERRVGQAQAPVASRDGRPSLRQPALGVTW